MASYKELLEKDYSEIASMSRSELAKTVKTLSAVANKRLNRLEQSGQFKNSFVYDNAVREGRFSSGGKLQGQLQREYMRLKNFLQAKTSTVKGAREVRHRVEKRAGVSLSDNQNKEMWQKYRAHREEFNSAFGSTNAINMLANIYANYDGDANSEIYGAEDIERINAEMAGEEYEQETDEEYEFFTSLRGTEY